MKKTSYICESRNSPSFKTCTQPLASHNFRLAQLKSAAIVNQWSHKVSESRRLSHILSPLGKINESSFYSLFNNILTIKCLY